MSTEAVPAAALGFFEQRTGGTGLWTYYDLHLHVPGRSFDDALILSGYRNDVKQSS
jgi:hypothetical protein